MDKKIASEFAFGVIIFVVVVIGGIFFLQSHQSDSSSSAQIANPMVATTPPVAAEPVVVSSQPNGSQSGDACAAHYYEGDQKVHVWPVADATNDDNGLVLNIQAQDAQALPAEKTADGTQSSNYTVKLVDASQAVNAKIKGATQEKPALITIKGYAQVCTQPPLVSIQPATVAFKKG